MESSADTVLRLLVRRWIFLVIAAVIGGAIGIGISATQPTKYASSAFLLGHATGQNPADSSLVASSAKVYARAATDPGVIASELRNERVTLDPARVAQYVTAIASPDTPLLEIKATTDTASQCVQLANAVAKAIATYSRSLSPGTGYEMQAFRSATPPTGAVGPGAALFALAGVLLGLLGAVIAIVVIGEIREQPSAAHASQPPVGASPPAAAPPPAAPAATPPLFVAPPPAAAPAQPHWPPPVASIPPPATDDRPPATPSAHAPWQFERASEKVDNETRRVAPAPRPKRESAAKRETAAKRDGVAKRANTAKRAGSSPKLDGAAEPRPPAEGSRPTAES
jgi:capsular polysaccharide biosynthesis protein